jgi:hypothetical protein
LAVGGGGALVALQLPPGRSVFGQDRPATSARPGKPDPFGRLFAPLRPTNEEMAALKEAEKRNPAEFVRRLAELDRKYKVRSIETLQIDKKIINHEATSRAPQQATPYAQYPPPSIAEMLNKLSLSKELACDCVVPFMFRRLDVYTNMSGPETDQVRQGILGAYRRYTNEYSVWNPGDTTGKTRVHIAGQMHISFSARLPQAGRWCLLYPSGQLWIRGHSRVVGHGNSTTSYDAKVWVDYYQVLQSGSQLLELSGGEIHYDGTRSEDRTRYFNEDRQLLPRYLFFNAQANDELLLTLRLEVDTAANEDGLATGVIDIFGFPANTPRDYDTFVVKAS